MDLYWWSNRNKKAVALAKTAKKNDIKNPDFSLKLAQANHRINDKTTANKIIDSIIRKYPDNIKYINFKKSLQK
jgi:TolA-binding protein